MRRAAVARVAGHLFAPVEIIVIDDEHHLNHHARRDPLLLVVLLRMARNMAELASNAKRSADVVHRQDELFGRNVLEQLNILVGLPGSSWGLRGRSALRLGGLRRRSRSCQQENRNERQGRQTNGHKNF
jgi:hypothetical protein